jgi:hypothetical protein
MVRVVVSVVCALPAAVVTLARSTSVVMTR